MMITTPPQVTLITEEEGGVRSLVQGEGSSLVVGTTNNCLLKGSLPTHFHVRHVFCHHYDLYIGHSQRFPHCLVTITHNLKGSLALGFSCVVWGPGDLQALSPRPGGILHHHHHHSFLVTYF